MMAIVLLAFALVAIAVGGPILALLLTGKPGKRHAR